MINKEKIKKIKKKKRKKEKEIITKDMTIAEAVNNYPSIAPIFMKYGLSCIGCPFALSETIKQSSNGHGINYKNMIEEMNSKLNKEKKRK